MTICVNGSNSTLMESFILVLQPSHATCLMRLTMEASPFSATTLMASYCISVRPATDFPLLLQQEHVMTVETGSQQTQYPPVTVSQQE